MPLYSSFSFSPNNRACQQLAKLLLLWRKDKEVTGWGFGCSALHGKDNAISDVEGDDGAFVPFISPWFQYLLTIRNMPPLAFGIHNEQYDCDMVIRWGL